MNNNDFFDFLHIVELDYVLNFTFYLQQFAAEDEGRTEDPTEYKKKKSLWRHAIPWLNDLNIPYIL